MWVAIGTILSMCAGVNAVASRSVAQVARGECDAASAMTGFNMSEYFGKWYQQAVSKEFFDLVEQGHPLCVTAEYSLNPAGYISVDNKGYDSTGGMAEAVGKATQADPNVASLEISFFGPVTATAPYNIIKMLYDANGQYRVALVWSCSLGADDLWVLSRTRTIEESDYTTMMNFANQSGINVDYMRMQRTVQNCTN